MYAQETKPEAAMSNSVETTGGVVVGDAGRFLSRTKIVRIKEEYAAAITQATNEMRRIKREPKGNAKGPQTIEEASAFLSQKINMACPPTKCLEHNGGFYFSGGTSARPVHDFSSGLFIKKHETDIYEWTQDEESGKGRNRVVPPL